MSTKTNDNVASVFNSTHRKIDFVFKIILIGAQSVGKSSILNQYVEDEFCDSYISTIGVDFRLKTIATKCNKVVKLQIWDTAGQERFAALTSSHYKGAHACICVYDVTSEKSFTVAQSYLQTSIQQHGISPQTTYLVANKTDLPDHKIPTSQGKQLSESFSTHFLETSAKQKQNISNLFESLVEHLIETTANTTESPSKKRHSIDPMKLKAIPSDDLSENQSTQKKKCCS